MIYFRLKNVTGIPVKKNDFFSITEILRKLKIILLKIFVLKNVN